MNGISRPGRNWLAAGVAGHLVISLIHGLAHTRAHVALLPAENLFVFIVILAGPVIGLALAWPFPRTGVSVIAITMIAALVFGVLKHFVLISPDQVSHVASQWRGLFGATAVLVALTEALACALAVALVRERKLS